MIEGVSVSDGKNAENIRTVESFYRMLDMYYKEVEASLRINQFDVLGHIGIYKRYLTEDLPGRPGIKACIDEFDDSLARACASSGKIIEINTSGLFAPSCSIIPTEPFLRSYYGYGGRTLSLGSDAHCASHLVRGFDEAVAVLKEIGFKYIYLPWDKNRPVSI
jgi:histidinol-phosphatase (PHP family)